LRRAARAARDLHATPAASIAIAAALDPHGLAVIDDAGAVTWSELDERAAAIGGGLASGYGAGPDGAVAIMCRNHLGAIEALAAAARAGADALLLNTELTATQLPAVMGGYQAAAIVCDDEFAGRLADVAIPRVLASELDAVADCAERADRPSRRGRLVILTSGTTGTPKGAARDIPARAMAGPIVAMIEQFGLRRGEPVLIGPPLFHGFGLGVASVAHGIGAPIVLHRKFDPRAALDAIAEHRVGCMVGVPVMLQRMLAVGPGGVDLSSLRAVVSAGAPLPPSLSEAFMDTFGELLCNGYGTTETGFGSYASPADLRAAPGTIGRPPLGTVLQVLDGERRPVPTGQTGHIFIGGELVFDGYVGGGSKERVGAMVNTGDLGHLDDEGRLFVDGREDDMIVSGGENVFPQEIEDALRSHAAVADVAVVGVDDAEFGQRLRAFVVGDRAAAADLEAHVRARLERYKVPRDFVFCEEIPRNATGKTLRRVLRERQPGEPSAR
jgi:fatty-acyl-CoA synthase